MEMASAMLAMASLEIVSVILARVAGAVGDIGGGVVGYGVGGVRSLVHYEDTISILSNASMALVFGRIEFLLVLKFGLERCC